jgi:DNA helicase-2/ATP-dependent DNA helicase PcrA
VDADQRSDLLAQPRDHLLVGLTEAQRVAVTSDAAPLCVMAGAGSGKTRVLTRRVARRVLDGSAAPQHTLVVTFTRKAAGELRRRLAGVGVPGPVRAGTFHAVALAELRHHWAEQGRRPPALLEHPARVLSRVVDASPGSEFVTAVAGEISWAQARLLTPAHYPAAAQRAERRGPPAAQVATAYAAYEEEKRRRGLVDMNDLIVLAAQLLEEDPGRAAAFRWRSQHLFVDEFQDVNPAQWRLLRAWLGERRDLFVVGDPHQAVYAWNGADPGLMVRLPELLEGTTVLRLDANHRSSPQILAAAAAVLGDDAPRPDPGRDRGSVPAVRSYDDDEAEAAAVVRWLRQVRPPGGSWARLAVLARTNARLDPVVRALTRAGIPFRLAGDGTTDPEVRGLVARLRALAPGSRVRAAVAELLAEDAAAAGPGSLDVGVDGPDDRAGVGLGPGGPDVVHAAGAPDTAPAVDRPTGRLLALVDELTAEQPDATVADLVAWLAAGRDGGPDAGGDPGGRVDVATFHRAKGLEWRSVAVVGLEAGMVPIAYATAPAARAEERRLLYVALTRAEEELWCSWAQQRSAGTRRWRCEPSPLLAPLEAAVVEGGDGTDPNEAPARLRELRARLATLAG